MTKQEVADQEAARFIAEMNAEIDELADKSRGDLEATLFTIRAMRDAKNDTIRALEGYENDVRRWLQLHDPERLHDGEHGLQAWLKDEINGSAIQPCDFVAMWEQDQALFKQLVMNGCIRIHMPAVKEAGALVAGHKKYLGPKPMKSVLKVEKVKE